MKNMLLNDYITFILKTAFVSLVAYLLLSSRKKQKNTTKKRTRQLKETIDRLFKNNKSEDTYYGRLIQMIDDVIQSSNIQKYLPFMDVSVFMLLSIVLAFFILFLGYTITQSITISIFMAALSSMIPKIILDVMSASNTKKIRKLYLSFLNAFHGFYNISGDIIHAFDRSAEYTTEPLRSFIKEAVLKYNRSNIEFVECLDDLEQKIRDKEFKKFIKFTKLHLIYGGDYRKALSKLIQQARRLESSRAMLAASALSGTVIISGVILLDLLTFFSVYISNPQSAEILRSTVTGQAITIYNLFAVSIGIYMVTSLNKG